MKKFWLRMLASVLSAAMIFSAAGCDKNGGIVDNGKYLEGHIEVKIVKAGYGITWLDSIADSYEAAFPGCTVEVKDVQDRTALPAQIKSQSNTADIIVTVDPLFSSQTDGYLLDLSDVLKTVPEGFETSSYDRMNKSLREYYETDDGKIYQLPWTAGFRGFLYNKSTLDKLYGEGKYTLPRTTDELLEMCSDIWQKSNQSVYPYVMSIADTVGSTVLDAFWYQYSGETSRQCYYGYYPEKQTDGSVKYKKCETTEEFETMLNDRGRIKSLEFYEKLFLSVELGGYAHSDCDRMSFQEAQSAFFGYGYGTNLKECAFMLNGDWIYKEMKDKVDKTDVRFMRMPVLSSIVETLASKASEEQLRAIVAAVDEGRPYDSALGVTEAEYERIADCRFMSTPSGDAHVIAVPKLKKGGAKYDLAKQFLKYLLSAEGQALFVMDQQGLSMPYGFDTSGFKFNAFTESVQDVTKHGEYHMIPHENFKSPLVYAGGMVMPGYIESMFFRGSETPTAMLKRFNDRNMLIAEDLLDLIV